MKVLAVVLGPYSFYVRSQLFAELRRELPEETGPLRWNYVFLELQYLRQRSSHGSKKLDCLALASFICPIAALVLIVVAR